MSSFERSTLVLLRTFHHQVHIRIFNLIYIMSSFHTLDIQSMKSGHFHNDLILIVGHFENVTPVMEKLVI